MLFHIYFISCNLSAESEALLDEFNSFRKYVHLPALKINDRLTYAAQEHAVYMSDKEKLTYYELGLNFNLKRRLKSAGYKDAITYEEHIWAIPAKTSLSELKKTIMNDVKYNYLVNPKYNEIGISRYLSSANYMYWDIIFATKTVDKKAEGKNGEPPALEVIDSRTTKNDRAGTSDTDIKLKPTNENSSANKEPIITKKDQAAGTTDTDIKFKKPSDGKKEPLITTSNDAEDKAKTLEDYKNSGTKVSPNNKNSLLNQSETKSINDWESGNDVNMNKKTGVKDKNKPLKIDDTTSSGDKGTGSKTDTPLKIDDTTSSGDKGTGSKKATPLKIDDTTSSGEKGTGSKTGKPLEIDDTTSSGDKGTGSKTGKPLEIDDKTKNSDKKTDSKENNSRDKNNDKDKEKNHKDKKEDGSKFKKPEEKEGSKSFQLDPKDTKNKSVPGEISKGVKINDK